jgi:hypothetical protein
MIDHTANLVDHLHDTHSYAREHLKLANDQMKTRYDRWPAVLAAMKALSPKLHEGEVAQTLILMGGPTRGSYPDKGCCKNWRYACRLFGANSLKEGAM